MRATNRQPWARAKSVFLVAVVALFSLPATAASPSWLRPLPPPGGAPPAPDDPTAPPEAGVTADLQLRGDLARGYVPPFRAAERDRLAVGPAVAIDFDRVLLQGSWAWLRDRAPDGATTTAGAQGAGAGGSVAQEAVASGPGDIRLGTVVSLLDDGRVEDLGLRPTVGWGVKLPDAADEGDLGTDETDCEVGLGLGYTRGAFSALGGVALGIWGNPLRYANQDDLALFHLEAGWAGERRAAGLLLDGAPESDRNPGRWEAGATLRQASREGTFYLEASFFAGLTPAAADTRLGLAIGASRSR